MAKIKTRPSLEFVPKEDITVYELALALKFFAFLIGITLESTQRYYNEEDLFFVFDKLDEKVKRHFVVKYEN